MLMDFFNGDGLLLGVARVFCGNFRLLCLRTERTVVA